MTSAPRLKSAKLQEESAASEPSALHSRKPSAASKAVDFGETDDLLGDLGFADSPTKQQANSSADKAAPSHFQTLLGNYGKKSDQASGGAKHEKPDLFSADSFSARLKELSQKPPTGGLEAGGDFGKKPDASEVALFGDYQPSSGTARQGRRSRRGFTESLAQRPTSAPGPDTKNVHFSDDNDMTNRPLSTPPVRSSDQTSPKDLDPTLPRSRQAAPSKAESTKSDVAELFGGGTRFADDKGSVAFGGGAEEELFPSSLMSSSRQARTGR